MANKVEFNLLPDTKMDVVKANRTRSTIISIAFLVSAVSLAIFILLFFTADVLQSKQLKDANNDINTANNKLRNTANLEKILTVQNQLSALTKLHQGKHINSRIYAYLPQVTPTNVSIGSLTLDNTANTLQISGTAVSQHAVNTFIDTLKFTTYTPSGGTNKQNAFPSVVETNFALGTPKVSYVLQVTFDPALFSNAQSAPTLNVPNLTTTRSVLEDPSNLLFNGQTGGQKKGNQ